MNADSRAYSGLTVELINSRINHFYFSQTEDWSHACLFPWVLPSTEPSMKYMLNKCVWREQLLPEKSGNLQGREHRARTQGVLTGQYRDFFLQGVRESGRTSGAQVSHWEQAIRCQPSIPYSIPCHPLGSPSEWTEDSNDNHSPFPGPNLQIVDMWRQKPS